MGDNQGLSVSVSQHEKLSRGSYDEMRAVTGCLFLLDAIPCVVNSTLFRAPSPATASHCKSYNASGGTCAYQDRQE